MSLKGKLQTQLHSKLIFSFFFLSQSIPLLPFLWVLVASLFSALFLSFHSFFVFFFGRGGVWCRLSSVGGGPLPSQVNPISISYDATSSEKALPCCALIQVLNWGVMKHKPSCCMLPMWQGVKGTVWCRDPWQRQTGSGPLELDLVNLKSLKHIKAAPL